MLARYGPVIYRCICRSHKSEVDVRSKQLNRLSLLWRIIGHSWLILQCVGRARFINLQKNGTSLWNFVPNFGLRKILPRHVDSRKCCQLSSSDNHCPFSERLSCVQHDGRNQAHRAVDLADRLTSCNLNYCREMFSTVVLYLRVQRHFRDISLHLIYQRLTYSSQQVLTNK